MITRNTKIILGTGIILVSALLIFSNFSDRIIYPNDYGVNNAGSNQGEDIVNFNKLD